MGQERAQEFWRMVYGRETGVVCRSVAGETILVPIRGSVADMRSIFTMSGVADRIWDLLDGARRLGEIRDTILAEYEVEPGTLDTDLAAFIDQLQERGLAHPVTAP